MRIALYLKKLVLTLVMVSVALLPLWVTGCAKESTTATGSKTKPSAAGSTTGPGAEVPEPAAEEKKTEEKSEEKPKEETKEEAKEEAKSEEKKPE